MLRQFILLFFGAFFICQFVLMMQFVWRYVDDLIGKGLTLDVLGQFFWYMALMMVPQALPLAILLASLITMGNLGESSELTAIKASGISLLKCLRPLIMASFVVAGCSFIFQNNIGPKASSNLRELLYAMKQKSPELEIPEEIFYNGIPNCNLYVQHKDMDTGKLYGVMIYRMTGSFEDAAIILADSGMLQSTADKKHLKLSLWHGEWFENLRSQEMGGQANVPYRRESFIDKVIILDFDNGLKLEDTDAQNANANSILQLTMRIDSLNGIIDSSGRATRHQLNGLIFTTPKVKKRDSLQLADKGREQKICFDTLYNRLSTEVQKEVTSSARSMVERAKLDIEIKGLMAQGQEQLEREFEIERINKFTLSFLCVVFFFIGASLGAIIRKGGLGVPIIISVLVYILFFILDNTGFRMARSGLWTIGFGKGLSPGVLIPLAIFISFKANRDSMVFNIDAYRNFFMHLFGMRFKRHVSSKEVVIIDPDYANDAIRVKTLNEQLEEYAQGHKLMRLPNPITVFFKYVPDHAVEQMSEEMESILENLGNTRDKYILAYINMYPIVAVKAHTRPFDRKWMNVVSAIIFPVGIILYIRMWRFRLRLYNDMKQIKHVNELLLERISQMEKEKEEEKNKQNE